MKPQEDVLPPHDEAAEKALLGCIMLKPDVMAELRSQVIPELFYALKNRMIWDACCEIVDSGSRLDSVTLSIRLTSQHVLDKIGLDYIGALEDFTPSGHNWAEYLGQLRECYALRSIIRQCTEYAGRAQDRSNASTAILDAFELETANIRMGIAPGRDFADNTAIGKQLMTDYQAAMDCQVKPGLQTGFADLDNIIGGMKPQDLIVVAGSPSAGKTSLVLNIAQHVALEAGVTVGVVSLETSAKKLLHRNNCSIARVNGGRLMTGKPQNQDLDRLFASSKTIKKSHAKLIISDRGGLTAYHAASLMRRQHQKGARLFILDYLQLLRIEGKSGNRNEEVGKISNVMKAVAKELDCPVIVICAINRSSERENRAPKMSDLRESGQLEFDADICLLLHPQDQNQDVRTVEVNVAKNKDGETGKINLTFFPPEMRFESAARFSQDDIPQNHKNQ